MSRNSRRGVIFDDNHQPHIIHNPNYDLGEEEAPLQRPRPPENPASSESLVGGQYNANIIRANNVYEDKADSGGSANLRRTVRTNSDRRWSANRLSKRLSVMLWGGQGGGAFPGRPSRPAGGNSYDSCQSGSSDGRHQRHYSCRELLCVALVPCVLLSLVAIGICSLLIYFHLLQEYQSKIDRLQAELQAVRDKDGAVFLPQEMYEEQTKKLESQEEEIKTITKEIKSLETERDELVVSISELFENLFYLVYCQIFCQQ